MQPPAKEDFLLTVTTSSQRLLIYVFFGTAYLINLINALTIPYGLS